MSTHQCTCRICILSTCKHARDTATVTDNVAWMPEAGVQLSEAAFECVYSRYQRHLVPVLVKSYCNGANIRKVNKTYSIQIYLYLYLASILMNLFVA